MLVKALSISIAVLFITMLSASALADFEPNNTIGTADPLTSGQPMYGTVHSSSDPDDYYSIYVSYGSSLYATLSGPSNADFDLYLYSPGGNLIDSSTGGSSSESISYVSTSSGTYYLRVYAFSGSGSYTLTATVSGTSSSFDIEPNNSIGTAVPVSSGDVVTGTVHSSSDPNDYYSIYISNGNRLSATLSGPTNADFDLFLYNSGGTTMQSSSGGSSSESISHTATSSGTYYLRVYAYSGSGSYTLRPTISYTTSDTTSPTITITSPTSSSTYSTSSSSISISGTASDNVGVTSVTWSNDRGGSGTCTGTTSWSRSNINLYSGTNVITVRAYDSAGNYGSDTLTVTYSEMSGGTFSLYEANSGGNAVVYVTGAYSGYSTSFTLSNGNGVFFGRCMQVTVTSYSSGTLYLTLERGTILVPSDHTVQNMVVTSTLTITLTSMSTQTVTFNAMCIEMDDYVPSSEDEFSISTSKVTGDLRNVVDVIDSRNSQNAAGQCAVWAITDNADKSQLESYGATSSNIESADNILVAADTGVTLDDSFGAGFLLIIIIIIIVIVVVVALIFASTKKQPPVQPPQQYPQQNQYNQHSQQGPYNQYPQQNQYDQYPQQDPYNQYPPPPPPGA